MALLTTLLLRVLVLALAAISAVSQIAYLDALYWRRLGWVPALAGNVQTATLPVVGADAVVSLLAAVVAVSLAFRRKKTRGGPPMALAVAAWAYLLAYGGVFRLLVPAQDSVFRLAFEAHFLFVECLGLAGLLAFSAAFPVAMSEADLPDRQTLPVGVQTLRSLRVWLFRPTAPWIAALALTTLVLGLSGMIGTPTIEAPLNPVMDLARFATFAAVVINFRGSWDARDADGRCRLLWMAVGMSLLVGALALLVGGNILVTVTGWRSPLNWRPIVLNLGLLGLLWGSAMAVFYDGRMNPETLVRQSATWAGLATALLFLAAGLEALFSDAMVARISLPVGVGSMAAICLFAWIFDPVRRMVEGIVEQVWSVGLPDNG